MAIQDLEKILQKDPVIHTFRPDELISNPERVESNYSLHAETHMSIGDTGKYYERLCNCLVINKTTFVGAVVGDYGEGKTSLMIYFWHRCEADKIFAIPPYVWFDFQDNFRVIYSWTRYRVSRINERMAVEVDDIYKRYRDPSLEKLAQEDIQKTGGNYDATLKLYKERFEQGALRIELSVDDLLRFCSEITALVSKLGYKGFLVFNDELEFTVEAPGNSLNKIAGILFELGDSLINGQGNYGFFFGMARNFQSQIHAARSAVLDRLAKQNVFMRLSEVYGQDFPRKLWDKYIDYFELGNVGEEVVAPETLEAIGQICDSSRRDLGNGPRSVISAFNRMVFVYNNYNRQYSPLDFVEDCLNNEITLGTESSYTKLVKELLADSAIRDTRESSLKLLAAYPRGCPRQIIKKYKLEDEVDDLIKLTGFGRIIFDTGYGYGLVKLQLEDVPRESIADEMMRSFYSHYSASKDDLAYAVNAFREMILPRIFAPQQRQSIEDWKWPNRWSEYKSIYSIELNGTFPLTKQYPERNIAVTVVSDINRDIRSQFIPENMDFSFIFDLSASASAADASNIVLRLTANENDVSKIGFSINLLNGKYPVRLQLSAIPENEKTACPLFTLALLGYMEDKELPRNEELEYNNVKQRLVKNLLISIFNEDMLRVDALDIELDNKGEMLIPELFLFLCRKKFPDYSTLICQPQWESKIRLYSNVLGREDIPLSVKRGSEPWQPSRDARESRKIIADRFNISAANLETWMKGLEALVDYSKLSDGILGFRIHPLEKLILDELEKCPVEKKREVKVSGKECQWMDATDVIQMITPLGYTQEELKLIVGEIGKARNFFGTRKYYFPEEGREFDIIYRVPVSISELQENLKEKVRSLDKEYEYLEAVKGFSIGRRKALDEVLGSIGKLSNEEDYERIKNDLHGRFEINHRWISVKLEDFKNSLSSGSNTADQYLQEIRSGGAEAELKKRVEGQARWITTFRELIQENLRKQLDGIRADFGGLEKEERTLVNEYSLDATAIAREGAEKLYDFQRRVEDFTDKVQSLERQVQNMSDFLSHYRQWLRLIKRSDEVYDEAVKIKTSPLYGEGTYLTKHQEISSEIEKHLKQYNIQGLGEFEAYLKELGDLGTECKNFYGRFKDAFVLEKELLISFLKKVSASTSIVRESFNPDEPKGSYDNLYDQVHDSAISAISEISDDLKNMSRNVDYLFNILDKGSRSSRDLIREKLNRTQEEVSKLRSGLNREWLREVLSAIDISPWTSEKELPNSMNEVVKSINGIRENLQFINKEYHGILRPSEANEIERAMLDCFKRGEESNLKEVILSYVGEEEDKSGKLNEVLEILKSLFKKNLIEIKVKRT